MTFKASSTRRLATDTPLPHGHGALSVPRASITGLDASRPLSVSRIANRLAEIIDARLRGVGTVWVQGEIGDLRWNVRGTLRFTLTDGKSRIECIWWTPPSNLAASLTTGAHVVVRGCPKVFIRAVGLVFVMSEVRPLGAGADATAREQVRARLSAEGLFEPARKRRLPRVPRAVAVVTGRSSAAWHDVLAIASRRHPGIPVVLVPALMQGDASPESIRTALRAIEGSGLFDVVVITRGGGAASDLTAFDDESLARAIGACGVPVVTAIGHELDFSIADAVADCREPTPSAAAARVIPDRGELILQIQGCHGTMAGALRERLARDTNRLDTARSTLGRSTLVQIATGRRRLDRLALGVTHDLERRIERARGDTNRVAITFRGALPELIEVARSRLLSSMRDIPRVIARHLDGERGRFELQAQRLSHAMSGQVNRQRARQERLAAKFALLDPLSVLRRGYAVVRGAGGEMITSVSHITPGATLIVQFHDGAVAVSASVQSYQPAFIPGVDS